MRSYQLLEQSSANLHHVLRYEAMKPGLSHLNMTLSPDSVYRIHC